MQFSLMEKCSFEWGDNPTGSFRSPGLPPTSSGLFRLCILPATENSGAMMRAGGKVLIPCPAHPSYSTKARPLRSGPIQSITLLYSYFHSCPASSCPVQGGTEQAEVRATHSSDSSPSFPMKPPELLLILSSSRISIHLFRFANHNLSLGVYGG